MGETFFLLLLSTPTIIIFIPFWLVIMIIVGLVYFHVCFSQAVCFVWIGSLKVVGSAMPQINTYNYSYYYLEGRKGGRRGRRGRENQPVIFLLYPRLFSCLFVRTFSFLRLGESMNTSYL